jgi:asparagine synthase (glutamine-hydrolysing)
MCGIIGFASTKRQVQKDYLKNGLHRIAHRGPDASGIWISNDQRVCLGHRRLSIIDLSSSGTQPMFFPEEKLVITFNGEIYNFIEIKNKLKFMGYRFKTNTDTEVLLQSYAEWGVDCVNHFVGMFAFVIYDIKQEILFLSRDRAGEKPFYYYFEHGNLHFCSEIKGLLSFPSISRKLNDESLEIYLALGYILGNDTLIHNIKKLPKGHSAIFNLRSGELNQWEYWQLPDFENANYSAENILNDISNLLSLSVKRQLISDVPVGILLSGGVDSSIITAIAAENSKAISTFTLKNTNKLFDESKYAKYIADYFSTNHTELILETETLDIEEIVSKIDEPIGDSSLIPTYLISKLIKSHCTVAIGGDGGDELFGGYKSYSELLKFYAYLRFIPNSFSKGVNYFSKKILPLGFKGRSLISRLDYDRSYGLPNGLIHFDFNERSTLLKVNKFNCDILVEKFNARISRLSDVLQRATRFDFENSFVEDILFKVDRMSMLNSLEMRAPFLDKEIIEYAFKRIPSNLKANMNERKIILKQLAQKILPKNFDVNRKQGFSFPLYELIENPRNMNKVKDTLFDNSSILNPNYVKFIIDGFNSGRSNADRIFLLYNFEYWRQNNLIT